MLHSVAMNTNGTESSTRVAQDELQELHKKKSYKAHTTVTEMIELLEHEALLKCQRQIGSIESKEVATKAGSGATYDNCFGTCKTSSG